MKKLIGFLLLALTFLPSISQNNSMKLSLDGEWRFKVDSTKAGVDEKWFAESLDRTSWQKVQAPKFWEGYPGLSNYDGWGWFARTVKIEKLTEPMSLHFAGVDDDAVVWLNGIEVGSHTGYSDPFAIDVGRAMRAGENLIVVRQKFFRDFGVLRQITGDNHIRVRDRFFSVGGRLETRIDDDADAQFLSDFFAVSAHIVGHAFGNFIHEKDDVFIVHTLVSSNEKNPYV